jgi:hypothetical protein
MLKLSPAWMWNIEKFQIVYAMPQPVPCDGKHPWEALNKPVAAGASPNPAMRQPR